MDVYTQKALKDTSKQGDWIRTMLSGVKPLSKLPAVKIEAYAVVDRNERGEGSMELLIDSSGEEPSEQITGIFSISKFLEKLSVHAAVTFGHVEEDICSFCFLGRARWASIADSPLRHPNWLPLLRCCCQEAIRQLSCKDFRAG